MCNSEESAAQPMQVDANGEEILSFGDNNAGPPPAPPQPMRQSCFAFWIPVFFSHDI